MENGVQCKVCLEQQKGKMKEERSNISDQHIESGSTWNQPSENEDEEEDLRVQLDEEISQREALSTQLKTAEARANSAIEQAHRLQAQLLALKQEMAISNRVGNQSTDQDIVEKMGALNHELQNWVVNCFRKVKIGSC